MQSPPNSAELFAPFGEPLLVLNFTKHRWVVESREESYSDWLKWILEQADATEVLRILGVEDPELFAVCVGAPVSVERESPTAEGHPGSTGRLDLKINLGQGQESPEP